VRPHVDEVRCIVSGTCELLAPSLFLLDDNGVQVLVREVVGEQLELARTAALACPSRALTLLGVDPVTTEA
jgi:ferredoxin